MSEISSIYFGNKAVQSIETKNGVLYGGNKFIFEEYNYSGIDGYKIVGSKYKVKDLNQSVDVVIPGEYKHKPVLAIECDDLFNTSGSTIYINSLTMPSSIRVLSGNVFRLGEYTWEGVHFTNFYYDGTLADWNHILFSQRNACPHDLCSNSYYKNDSSSENWNQIDNTSGMVRISWEDDFVNQYAFAFGVFIKDRNDSSRNSIGFELYLSSNQELNVATNAFIEGWCNYITPKTPSTWHGYSFLGDKAFYKSRLIEFITPQNQIVGVTSLPEQIFSDCSKLSLVDLHTSKINYISTNAIGGCSVLRTLKLSDSVQTTSQNTILGNCNLCNEIYDYSFPFTNIYSNSQVYHHAQEEQSIYITYTSVEGVDVHLRYVGDSYVVLEYVDVPLNLVSKLTLPSTFSWNGITCDKLFLQWHYSSDYIFDYTKISKLYVETNYAGIFHKDVDYTSLIKNKPSYWQSAPSVSVYFNGSMRDLLSQYVQEYDYYWSAGNIYFYGLPTYTNNNGNYELVTKYMSIEGTDMFMKNKPYPFYTSNYRNTLFPKYTITNLRIVNNFSSSIGQDRFGGCAITNLYFTGAIEELINYFRGYEYSYGVVQNPMHIDNVYVIDENGETIFDGDNYTQVTEVVIPSTQTYLYGGTSCVMPSNLTKITIPVGVTKFNNGAFYFLGYLPDSQNFSGIYYEGTIAQWNSINKESSYASIHCPVHCTDGNTTL